MRKFEKYLNRYENLNNKTIVITGSNSGIGYEAMLHFLRLGATVIMACRNIDKANKAMAMALDELKISNDKIIVIQYDQSDLGSINYFYQSIKDIKIDIFIFNAGIYYPKASAKGFYDIELTLATNYFGMYYLFNKLSDKFKNEAVKLIFVSSLVARNTSKFLRKMHIYDEIINDLSKNKCYSYSKFLVSSFVNEIIEQGYDAYLTHPGVTKTNILSSKDSNFKETFQKLGSAFLKLFTHSSKKASLTIVAACFAKKRYIKPRGIFAISGYPKEYDIPKCFNRHVGVLTKYYLFEKRKKFMKEIKLAMPNFKEARMRLKEVPTIKYELKDEYKNLGNGKSYYIFTYGCQGNEADSEVMSGILEQMGYTLSDEPYKSDVVLLNTCAIRENAENRIWGVLGHLKGAKRDNPNMLVGICGCMPQEEKTTAKLLETYDFVDLVFGTHNIASLPKLIFEAKKNEARIIEVISGEGCIYEQTPKIRKQKHKAWVNIMFGCDEFCTYCIVPYTRGKERSRDKDDIINEVKELVKDGYTEITLLGQNVNAYGKDLDGDYTFGDLLVDLDKTGIKRIRYTTSHPRDLDQKTIDAMASCKSVMPHLHLPVQSGDNDVLKKMNRKYTYEDYMDKVLRLKKAIPDIALTTDIIVGFPNETNEQFENTLKLVKNAGFEGAFTFIYSKRDGTPAAKMEDVITEEEKHERLQRLNEYVNAGYLKGHERFLGQVVEVLVDGESKNGEGMMCGYSKHLKLTHFKSTDKSLIGKLVNVKITEAKTWFMIGELCE